MRLLIYEDYEVMSQKAADYVVARIKAFAPTAAKPFVLGLPTGSTPLGLYRELIGRYQEGEVSFEHVVTFNMDEYLGLPPEHEESYHYFMWHYFFSHIDIKREHTHILNGLARDPKAECEAYECEIARYGGIDLFIGGVGRDGHIAFNEPGSSLSSRTRVKRLSKETIRDNARFFHDNPTLVPTKALTVGVGTVMDAREVLILINGEKKAKALQHTIEEGVNHLWTISALQLHPKATIMCDEAATEELKVGTYRYFKGLMRECEITL